MNNEVRYHMLRPAQIVARRKECPIAYVPLGTIEWHGDHDPVGTDALQAEGLAIRAARKGGGLAFPALWYGENRLEALMDVTSGDRAAIARKMELPPENFLPDRMPFPAMEQTLRYNHLLLHILAEVESLGFRVGVLVAGHYPLIDHARAAVCLFNQSRRGRSGERLLAWACLDYLSLRENGYPQAGDHAGGWETSHLLALHPETVDLSALPPKGEKLIGAGGKMAPQDATAAFGNETLDAAVEQMVRESRHRLENPTVYFGHGNSLIEGLWKTAPKNP